MVRNRIVAATGAQSFTSLSPSKPRQNKGSLGSPGLRCSGVQHHLLQHVTPPSAGPHVPPGRHARIAMLLCTQDAPATAHRSAPHRRGIAPGLRCCCLQMPASGLPAQRFTQRLVQWLHEHLLQGFVDTANTRATQRIAQPVPWCPARSTAVRASAAPPHTDSRAGRTSSPRSRRSEPRTRNSRSCETSRYAYTKPSSAPVASPSLSVRLRNSPLAFDIEAAE